MAKTPEQKAAEKAEREAKKAAKKKEKEANRLKIIDDNSIIDEESIYDLTKTQQEQVLVSLGLFSGDIKGLTSEKMRVDKIIQLRKKKNK